MFFSTDRLERWRFGSALSPYNIMPRVKKKVAKKGGGPPRRDPDNHVPGAYRKPGEFLVGTIELVLATLAGTAEGGIPPRDQPDDLPGIGVEGRGAFRGIEHSQPPAGARTHVYQSSAAIERGCHALDQPAQLRGRGTKRAGS